MSDQIPAPAKTSAAQATRRIARALLSALVMPAVFAVILLLVVLDREITAPSWVKAGVQDRAALVLDGGRLQFAQITLRLGRDLHPKIRLINGQVFGRDSALLAQIPLIEAGISPRALVLGGDLLAQEVYLRGAQLHLRRAANGSLALALGPDAAPWGRGGDLGQLLAQVDAVLARPALAALERVSASGLIVNFDDARAGRSWIIDGGSMALDLRGDGLALRTQIALLSGRAGAARMQLALDRASAAAPWQIAMQVDDVAASDLAAQLPALGWLRDVDAPLSGVLRSTWDAAGQLGPLHAALEIGAGVLQPDPAVRPFAFAGGKAYLRYDPRAGQIRFSDLALDTGWGRLRASGTADMADFVNGLPRSFIGQFRLQEMTLTPPDLFDAPLVIGRADADLRLRLDPFVLDIGQVVLHHQTAQAMIGGQLRAQQTGWSLALDGQIDQITPAQVLAFWPPALVAGARAWFAQNVIAADLHDLRGGLRLDPAQGLDWAAQFGFADGSVRILPDWPPLVGGAGTAFFQDGALVVSVDRGQITPAGQMQAVDVAGSSFAIADLGARPAQARVDLRASADLGVSLALVNAPPFRFLDRAGLPADLAQGRAITQGWISWPLRKIIPQQQVDLALVSDLQDLHSDRIVAGRSLWAQAMQLQIDRAGVDLRGAVRLGALPADVVWQQRFGADAGGAIQLRADFGVSAADLAMLGIALPEGMMTGRAQAQLLVDFMPRAAPQFTVTSDLVGAALRLAPVGWRKPAAQAGLLRLQGNVAAAGMAPQLDVVLRAGDLAAQGQVALGVDGTLAQAQIDRVQIGDWLDAQVTIAPRGGALAAQVTARRLDLRAAPALGALAGPVGMAADLALAQVVLSDQITLTDLRGRHDAGGLRFASGIGGQGALRGARGADGQWQLQSDDAGALLAGAGLAGNMTGGALELALTPRGAGSYDGTLTLGAVRLRDAPVLAALLDAISGIGLLQQLDGQGLAFEQIAAQFRLTPDQVIVSQAHAVGPGLGITIDGFYDRASGALDLQGVISPFYVINQIGSLLTRTGEGVIGFNFTVTGTASALRLGVNPLSVLAPAMLRNLFRRPPPELTP